MDLKTNTNLKEFLEGKEKSILFVHNKKSVEQIIPFRKILNENHCVIIPTSPEPLFVLDELKLSYRVPEDYYTPEENYNYTNSLELKIINLTEEIDEELGRVYPKIRQFGLKLALFHLFPFARNYYPLRDVYFKIKKIIQSERPDKIGLLMEKKSGPKAGGGLEGWLLWESNENLFQKVLNIYQSNLPLYSFVLNGTNYFPKSNFLKENWQNRIKKWLQGNPRFYYLLKILKNNRRFDLLALPYRQSTLTPLLLLNSGYDWEQCHTELFKRGYYIWGQMDDNLGNWYRNGKEDLKLYKNILDELEQSPSFRENFKEESIDFYPLLKDKISFFLKKIVPASLHAYQKTTQLIKKNRLKGVLFSINPTAISKSIAYAAQRLGIPVIGWQHGDMNCKSMDLIVFNDLLTSDLFLSWGEGASENRIEVANRLRPKRKQKVVGSASLDKLISSPALNRSKVLKKINIKDTGQPIIVYATNLYFLSNIYSPFYPPWSDNYIYNTQKKIINRLALLKGTKIIKLHPNLFYALPALDEYCKSFKKQNVWTIRNEFPSTLLFFIADIIIVDLPSTTILQAITYKKPIFCLTRHLKLKDKAKELLQKRVVLAEDPEDLMKEVESFIESGRYEADLNNTDFLESFGTLPDCRAAERAAVAVDEVVKSFSSK